MKKNVNISISAKDCDNDQLLLTIDRFSDNSVYVKLFNITENELAMAGYIEDKHTLNIIDAFLADVERAEYNLEGSDYRELYPSFADLIFYKISSYYFNATLVYNEIKLINLKEY